MKRILTTLLVATLLSSFSLPLAGGENWYICANCCKTKQADAAPWISGCKQSSGGTHNFWFCGKAGDYNYTCRYCDAEVYLTSSTSPGASKCCATGGTHDWHHK